MNKNKENGQTWFIKLFRRNIPNNRNSINSKENFLNIEGSQKNGINLTYRLSDQAFYKMTGKNPWEEELQNL